MLKSKWIWFPDDFEIELANRFMAKRYERDVFIPPFWKQYSCYKNVKFQKTVKLSREETVRIDVEGKFNVELDGAYVYNVKDTLTLPAGEHELLITVYNDKGLPCLRVEGESVVTDDTWRVTCNDHVFHPAKCDNGLIAEGMTPNSVRLPTEELLPTQTIPTDGGIVYDFGKEIFAFVRLEGIADASDPVIYYGESLQEVSDPEHCELLSTDLVFDGDRATTEISKAFRYVYVKGVRFRSITALFEYLPLERKNYFVCDDELLNRIYEVSQYTLSLNTREFLIDGIKRDRWVWGGDAYQSYLMHYYSYFDKSVIKRTMTALFGKSPFDLYMNHIMDYTFMWVIGFYEYYCYTGDEEYVRENLYKVFEVMDHCLGRRGENGWMDTRPGDWVFVDWAALDNSGEVCFEQILMVAALKNCIALAELFGEKERVEKYAAILSETEGKLEEFWDEEKKAYIYSFKNGKADGVVVKHPNLFALLYDLCDEQRKQVIAENVLKNPEVPAITTPYMRFFELAACCEIGETEYVLNEIRDYWGGMLSEGATTFWEAYDKTQKGNEKYAMYGRAYGKSLCHAWGASPLYLIGKYVVGLTPVDYGSSFLLKPQPAGLQRFSARLPLTKGTVEVSVTPEAVSVYSSELDGRLTIDGKTYEIKAKRKTEVIRK